MPSVTGKDGAGSGITLSTTFGVLGDSTTGNGVAGTSNSGDGVHGESGKAVGVRGVGGRTAKPMPSGVVGVWGDCKNGPGVYGGSDSAEGVHGESGGASGGQRKHHGDQSGGRHRYAYDIRRFWHRRTWWNAFNGPRFRGSRRRRRQRNGS